LSSPDAYLDIVCFPDMDWDHILWTNRQHIMYRLPQVDPTVRVLYVSPPRWALSGKLGRRARLRKPELAEASAADGLWVSHIGERLWVLQGKLPVPNRILRRFVPRLLDTASLALVRHTMKRIGMRNPVLWSYTPLTRDLLGRLGEASVVYDVLDDYPSLPEYAALGTRLVRDDAEMIRRADLVFCASKRMYEERKHLNAATHFVENAADIELFQTAQTEDQERPAELDMPRPIIGFHGSIFAYKLDLDTIIEVARRRPDWSFVFIGPVETRSDVLGSVHNIHLLGPRSQAELPPYLAHFDVTWVPYKFTRYTERLNSLKLHETLAAGRPVVAAALPCFESFGDLVRLARTPDGYISAIEEALEDDGIEVRRRRLEAVAHLGWDDKARRLIKLVHEQRNGHHR